MADFFFFLLAVLIICVLAICCGIWYEKKHEVEKRGRKKKYLVFSVIGLLSFFGGLCLGEGLHLGYVILKASGGPLTIFPFALIIYALLFSIGLYLSKEQSLGFVLKAFGISFIFIFLAFFGLMAYGAHQHYYAKYISVDKVSAQSDYVIITEEELAEFSALKEAIAAANKSEDCGTIVQVPPDEWERTRHFIGSDNIKVVDEYYEVGFMLA